VVAFVISTLLAVNVFFIKRLIDKIDKTEEIARTASQKATQLESAIATFVDQLKGIRRDMKGVHAIDKQLGKLEAQLDLLLKKDVYFSGHGGNGNGMSD